MQNLWKPLKKTYRAEMLLDLPPASAFMYRTSNNMVQILSGPSVFSPPGYDAEYISQNLIVVGDMNTRRYILAGAVTAKRSMSYFKLIKKGRFHSIIVEQPHIQEGMEPEEVVVLEGDDWRELMIRYAEQAAEKMGVKPIDPEKNVTGYCSWYYYYAGVSEADFNENLAVLAKAHRESEFAPQVMQIDDGYQPFQGDWLKQNERWSSPMSEVAKKIIAADMTPGIWTMPLLASTASEVFTQHPDWFVKGADGQALAMRGWSPAPDHLWCCLDATNPEVREHLKNVFQTFYSWGYRYFKMDGLGFCMPEGRYFDPSVTPLEAFRLGLKTIREAVPDAYLLGCCPPFMACMGYVDACRVSPDTSRYWRMPTPEQPVNSESSPGYPGICNSLHATLSNWFLYDRFFRADPDALMARQDNAFYTFGEARISVLTGIVTGVCITSDHLGTIAPERMALLERAAKYRLRDVRPLDWYPDTWAQVFTGKLDGKPAAAIFNDSETTRHYDLAAMGFENGVEELLHPMGKISGELVLEAHDGALIVAG
ncbi:MAG: alpha-galactosidase [Lentisphaeria bacterium]|nr:alpha-galactosidase [Lentisphaeria bacterium]